MSTKVPQYKKDAVDSLVKLMLEYPIVGAVNMENMPTPQLQNMRAQLRGTVVIQMTKARLIKMAIAEVKGKKKGIEELEQYLRGMPALLFTRENPFKLYKTIQKNKSNAPAKAGQRASKDIWVKAGGTSFSPGPIIGELGGVGIKAGIVAIKQDKLVVKEGEIISGKMASILSRLKIEPMEIGLDLVATYEDGTIFTKSVLHIDESEFKAKLETASRWGFNLAMETCYPTRETMPLLIGKAFKQSKAVSVESNFLTEITAGEILAKAERAANCIKAEANL
jgi:large subunit ribosomal protein L10